MSVFFGRRGGFVRKVTGSRLAALNRAGTDNVHAAAAMVRATKLEQELIKSTEEQVKNGKNIKKIKIYDPKTKITTIYETESLSEQEIRSLVKKEAEKMNHPDVKNQYRHLLGPEVIEKWHKDLIENIHNEIGVMLDKTSEDLLTATVDEWEAKYPPIDELRDIIDVNDEEKRYWSGMYASEPSTAFLRELIVQFIKDHHKPTEEMKKAVERISKHEKVVNGSKEYRDKRTKVINPDWRPERDRFIEYMIRKTREYLHMTGAGNSPAGRAFNDKKEPSPQGARRATSRTRYLA